MPSNKPPQELNLDLSIWQHIECGTIPPRSLEFVARNFLDLIFIPYLTMLDVGYTPSSGKVLLPRCLEVLGQFDAYSCLGTRGCDWSRSSMS